ncbi:MAG TPA: BTAD domain-containing putative transcriptional regulator, partial [Solirubrobacteraceae bacterium]|nr:BTAD domain-containing putative transcriptional regulator [Solirubrobacteraceae bacterium]
EALALWRGDALAEFGEPFAVTEAARLDELRLACLEDRIDADLALGRHADVAAELEVLVARAGLRERLRGQLMLALYRCGRHADALAAYHDFRRTLDEELGLVPSAALADLERRILVQDPALAAPPRPAEQPPPAPAGRPEPVPPAEPSPPGPAAAPPAAEPAAAAATQPAPPPTPASASGVRELRRVTVLSCSLPGATELAERLDPEDLHELVRDFRRSCSEIVERFGGHVAWTAGHGHLAYFGLRCAREDDPRRAVRAGLAAAAAVSTAGGERVAIRCGVDTGLVVAGGPDGEEPLTGGAVADAAARLAAAAPPAGVLIGPATERLLRGAFELRARDGAFEVLREAIAPRSVADVHGRPPLIGRTHELGLLAERHRRAAAGHGQVVVVSGEPGIGKSRLVAELHRRAAAPGPGSRPIVVRCSPDHTGSALYPVATALAGPGHDGPEHEGDVELRGLLAPLLGTGGPAALDATAAEHKQRLLGVLSDRLLHAAAGDGARLVVFEDAHWADPSTLELLERLVREVATTSVLLVVTVRPGLAPSWTARSYVAQLTLDRFGDAEVAALVSALLGGTVPPTGLVAAIEERTDGVPLFVEEVVRAMLESGVLERRDDGAYDLAGPATALAIPETLHDLLVARLDRLGPAKAVAQVAAVLGRRFDRELLHAVELVDGAALDDALARLVE